ncbi:MAG: tetratricopeptide repeat protein, partial [Caulobacteraceae bacterium]
LKRPREAADTFRAAAAIAPASAPARLGLAVELLQLGELEEAASSAEAAVALDPRSALGWFALGAARRRMGGYAQAAEALETSLRLDPERRAACLGLGLVYVELDRLDLAERWLARAVELGPDDQEAHASLAALYCSRDRLDLGRRHALRALELAPKMVAAHQTLGRILTREGREAEARPHRDFAFRARNVFVAEAARPRQRVLLISAADRGNVPERHLLPTDRYTRIYWYIEYASRRQAAALPAYDVVFNAIGDDDEADATAGKVAAFVATCERPIFNRPEAVARTRRHLIPALVGDIAGLVAPTTVRIEAGALAKTGLEAAAREAGVTPPYLVRAIGSHGGDGLTRIATPEAARSFSPSSGRDHYVTAFADFRSADGLYRKYRVIFVDRTPYPYHLAVADTWMVHYQTSGMAARPDRLAEERRFLEDPEAALGHSAMEALGDLARRLDLDFAGADFASLADGRLLLFEANATMLVHPEAPDGPLAHKNPHVERIFAAFRGMLAGMS